jgi:hypothetical protein
MAPNDGFQPVLVAKLLGHIWTKLHTDAAFAWAATGFWLWICPQHLHHETRLAGLALLMSVEFPNIVQCHIVVRE